MSITDLSRVELAHRAHGNAVEEIQALAVSLDTAFARLEIARERLDQEGVQATVRMSDWLAQAFTHWRTARTHNEREQQAAARIAAAGGPLEHVPSLPILDRRD